MDQNSAAPLTDKDLDAIHWRATRGCHFEGNFLPGSKYAEEVIEQDVPRLVAEVRHLRAFRDEVAAGTQRIATGLDRLEETDANLVSELNRLRDLIKTYASTQMPFETFLAVALGEELAERIMATNAEQHALLEQANNRP